MSTTNEAIAKVANAIRWLKNQNAVYKILIKQTRNLGDTLHITPIARHYKIIYPKCKIAFIVGGIYADVHKCNPDFDKIFPINSKLNPQERITIGKYMMNHKEGIDKVLCPSIFPFGEVWKSHKWSYEIISHQYRHNAEIRPPNIMKGGGLLNAPVTQEDQKYASNFVKDRKCVAIEYNSYSHPVPWKSDKYAKFAALIKKRGWHTISLAGSNEGIISGTIDGRGISWRRTIAILSKCKYLVGIGSGVTMLGCCANPMPIIFEINVSSSINMLNCGYSKTSVCVQNPTPEQLARKIQ